MPQLLSGKSASEQLLDAAIKRQVLLERFSVGEQRKITRFLEREVFPDLVARLRRRLDRIRLRGTDSGVFRTKRYRDMVAGIAVILRDANKAAYLRVRDSLQELGIDEARWQAATMRSAVPFDIDFIVPPAPLLKGIVTARPFQGALLRKWFAGQSADTQARLVQQVNIGLAEGEGIEAIVRRVRGGAGVRGALQTTAHNARSIVRTAVQHVSFQSRQETYKENSDLIKGIVWVATLDSALCPACFPLDGQVFPLEGEPQMPSQPLHHGCRCVTSPVLVPWSELGISVREESTPATRASMNGQVPKTLTAQKWLKTQPAAVQNSVLGVERARLWREGRLSASEMTNQAHRPISLRELRRLGRVD